VALRCVAATAVAVAGTSCAAGGSPTAAGTPSGDPRQDAPAVRSGHLLIKVLTARCAIHVLSGTHDLLDAAGEFCRIRVRVESADSSSHDFSTGAQRLVLADGQELAPSSGGMAVRRQPDTVPLGADDLAEVVVSWDIPAGAAAAGVRLVGDHDPDAAGRFVTGAVAPNGVVVRLRGLRPVVGRKG
jgi:hypothetical protein